MGLTIHYSGKLRQASELESMIDEVRDIAIEKGWNYFVFENKFMDDVFSNQPETEHLFGIMVTPKDAEPMCFSFLSDGRMCGIINFNVIQINSAIDEEVAFSLFTKTQYAGFEIHKELIILLDYISKKYLTDFECIDDGEYWETRDEDLLIETFRRYGSYIDGFASSLEMLPQSQDENMEDYIERLANSTQNRVKDVEENLPELSIEDENKFKRMKIELEHDGVFGKMNADIPPEIESIFLDNIMQFENQFKNAKRITVYEKVGKPNWIKSQELSAEQLKEELERLFVILEDSGIVLDILYDYPNEILLIYNFITLELFNEETDDISIEGMTSNFIYEEFHPNYYEDLRKESFEFWTDYFANNSEHFDEFTLTSLLNAGELIDFRDSFSTFKNIKINIKSVDFSIEDEKATTKVQLNFEAIIDPQHKVVFDCESAMDFIFRGYWSLEEAELPR
jgi:hypothetical protein